MGSMDGYVFTTYVLPCFVIPLGILLLLCPYICMYIHVDMYVVVSYCLTFYTGLIKGYLIHFR